MRAKKIVGATAAFMIVFAASTALVAGFNFGITPTTAEKGVQERGDRFYASFYIISRENSDIDVEVQTAPGTFRHFKQLQPKKIDQFSEQACTDCFTFLKGDGTVTDRGSLSSAGNSVKRWKPVEFFVDVPKDMEPGYHMMQVTPQPTSGGSAGAVGIVSTASFPVIFRVPGDAVRSGKFLGIHAGRNNGENQEVVATFYNTGTVTIGADVDLIIETLEGNKTFDAGRKTVGPEETATFNTYVSADMLPENKTFSAYAVADYNTGNATDTATVKQQQETMTPQAQVIKRQTETPYLYYFGVVILLSLTSAVTWKVIHRGY